VRPSAGGRSRKISTPTMIMRGQWDGIASFRRCPEFFRRLPNPDKHFAVMPGISHATSSRRIQLVYAHPMELLAQPAPSIAVRSPHGRRMACSTSVRPSATHGTRHAMALSAITGRRRLRCDRSRRRDHERRKGLICGCRDPRLSSDLVLLEQRNGHQLTKQPLLALHIAHDA